MDAGTQFFTYTRSPPDRTVRRISAHAPAAKQTAKICFTGVCRREI